MSAFVNLGKTKLCCKLYLTIVCPLGQRGHMLTGWVRAYSVGKLDRLRFILYLKITCQRNPGCVVAPSLKVVGI